MTHREEVACISDESSSDTSTPDYKRGQHQISENEKMCKLICVEGIKYVLPKWIPRRKEVSLLILADSRVKDWPWIDRICEMVFHQNRPLKQWTQSIREGQISTKAHTVILYLEGTRS